MRTPRNLPFLLLFFLAGSVGCEGLNIDTQNPAGKPEKNEKDSTPVEKEPLQWTPCQNERLKNLECARLEVPLDHDNPTGPKISLALSRNRHTDPDYRGVILSHPGGPGSSGLRAPYYAYALDQQLGAKYDWVSLDPRGVGQSHPKLDCVTPQNTLKGLPNVPQDQVQVQRWKTQARRVAEQCSQGEGSALLPFLNTSDLARDLEAVRQALDVEKVTYFGASYGSYVGQFYASMFPHRIDKMILDGVIDVGIDDYDHNLDQQRAFQKSADIFLAWLAENNAHFNLGSTFDEVRNRVYGKLDEVRALPEQTEMHPARLLTEALVSAGYSVRVWPSIGFGLSTWLNNGDLTPLTESVGSDSTNLHSIYLAVMCKDTAWPNWDTVLSDAKVSHEAYPLISWYNTWYNAPCAEWKIPATPPAPLNFSKITFPILLLSETHDAATPFKGALATRKRLPSSVLVEGAGGSSHSTAMFGSACTRETIYNFLDRGVLPPRVQENRADKQCPPRLPKDLNAARSDEDLFYRAFDWERRLGLQ